MSAHIPLDKDDIQNIKSPAQHWHYIAETFPITALACMEWLTFPRNASPQNRMQLHERTPSLAAYAIIILYYIISKLSKDNSIERMCASNSQELTRPCTKICQQWSSLFEIAGHVLVVRYGLANTADHAPASSLLVILREDVLAAP